MASQCEAFYMGIFIESKSYKPIIDKEKK